MIISDKRIKSYNDGTVTTIAECSDSCWHFRQVGSKLVAFEFNSKIRCFEDGKLVHTCNEGWDITTSIGVVHNTVYFLSKEDRLRSLNTETFEVSDLNECFKCFCNPPQSDPDFVAVSREGFLVAGNSKLNLKELCQDVSVDNWGPIVRTDEPHAVLASYSSKDSELKSNSFFLVDLSLPEIVNMQDPVKLNWSSNCNPSFNF